ncbi:alpha/beta fold family hydrolase [Myxococcus stipitatus DSM 14675]|uniref:Alpha/beta fold family hydrolase n=1 Tax=Myxococcus stipitatus (strain DSM 14675 / JCM 12634 / Mx s8) TaxID=1278073 RepID=L7U906_MYXSD|nr:alpha/beta hydrolase [Myxococcus stipitatus]AGC44052.1 alpha/beta fold family hydrolase [Myxococcus stipitatus DSM 14675]
MRAVPLLALILPLSLAQAQSLQMEPHTFQARDGRSVEAELGTLTVPLRHARPDGPNLPLRFVRFKSTNPSPGAPIVYLAGGPGGSGIDAARHGRFDLFLALREVADVIALDQRGTGQSNPHVELVQSWAIPLDQPADEAQLTAAVKKAAAEASENWTNAGVDLGAYNTEENADDLEMLRKALGAPKLNLWGISYGTHLGLSYLRRHTPQVERIILAGIEGPDDTWKRPAHAEALLAQWESVLRAEGAKGPGLRARLAKLLKSLKREPRAVEFADETTGERRTWRISHFDLQRTIFEMMRDPTIFRRFLAMLPALESGDFSPMVPFASMLREGGMRPMSLAMDAASGVSPARLALIQREAAKALLGGSVNPGPVLAGDVPGVRDLGESFRGPLKASVPVLLISGTLDGRTSPDNAEALRPGLSKATHLVLVGAGHDGLFQSDPRILERMKSFMKGEALRDERMEIKAKP